MKPKIVLDDEVYRKVMHWVNKSDMEVSGLGLIKVEADGVLRVTNAMLLPQKNGSTHTDIEPEDVNKALFELRHSDGELKWWWHSHVNMAVFWSGTDMDTIKKIGAGGWVAASVFNKKNEVRSAFFSRDGYSLPWGPAPLFLDELSLELANAIDPAKIAEWDDEYKKNVTIQRQTYGNMYGSSWIDRRSSYPGETQPQLPANSAAGVTAMIDFTMPPPPTRPSYCSKKLYKAWKKHWRDKEPLIPADEPTVDEQTLQNLYGFEPEELIVLDQTGWTLEDVDEALDLDFTPDEIVKLASSAITLAEVDYLTHQKLSPADIMVMVDQGDIYERIIQ